MSPGALAPWIADALILLGMSVITLGVFGIARMPDVFTKLHAASKSVFLGVCSLLVAISMSGDPAIMARSLLIGVLLLLTTPVAAHEIAKAAARERPMASGAGEPVAAGDGKLSSPAPTRGR